MYRDALRNLGVANGAIDRYLQAPTLAEARSRLADIKAAARANYRRLAHELRDDERLHEVTEVYGDLMSITPAVHPRLWPSPVA